MVATVPSIGDNTIEEYANVLYEKWGIGARGKDEGVLVLLSLDPRRIRVEVGYGAEGYLNDAKVGRLLDSYAVPLLKKNDYGAGILSLSIEVARAVETEKQIRLSLPARERVSAHENPEEISPFAVILFIIILIVMISTPFGRSLCC